jgi:tetratricopeptide (TPR) repeat protein
VQPLEAQDVVAEIARRHHRHASPDVEVEHRAFGPSHPTLALPLTKLAEIDLREGETDRARVRLERAIETVERVQGPDHPDLVWTLLPYARCLRLAGEAEAGLETLKRSMAIAESSYGHLHVETARVVEGFGYHFYGLRDFDAALRYFGRAREIREKVFGAGHRALGWNSYDHACVLALKGDRAAALEALREAVAVGWSSDLIVSDDDLDSLRGDPAFEAIVEEAGTRRPWRGPSSGPGHARDDGPA